MPLSVGGTQVGHKPSYASGSLVSSLEGTQFTKARMRRCDSPAIDISSSQRRRQHSLQTRHLQRGLTALQCHDEVIFLEVHRKLLVLQSSIYKKKTTLCLVNINNYLNE